MLQRALARFSKPIRHFADGRMMSTALSQRSIDDIPGTFDMADEKEGVRVVADPTAFLDDYMKRFSTDGDHGVSPPMIKMNTFGAPSVVLLSHDCVKQWHQYEIHGQKIRRGVPDYFQKLFGRPFADMAGPDHSAWRKKAMPAFKPNMMGKLAPFVQHSAQNLVLDRVHRESQKGEYLAFCPMAKRFAFEIGSHLIYGPLLNDEEREHVYTMFKGRQGGITPKAIYQAINDPDNPDTEWAAALRAGDEIIKYLQSKQLEAERLTDTKTWDSTFGDDADCLVRSLLENDAIFTQPGYGIKERVEFMMFFVAASFGTTATTMTNMIYTIWRNPEEAEKLRKVIMAHPELSNPDTVFTFDMLKNCNELECFINESTRMHNIVPFMAPRYVHDDDGVVIGGYHLPKGTAVSIPIQYLMSGEGSWTDPMEFKPSRFDKSNGESRADRGSIGSYNHIPFATGLHKCLGIHLAMLELRIYTTLLLRDWEFDLDESKLDEEGTVNRLNISSGLPHYNVYLKLRKREN